MAPAAGADIEGSTVLRKQSRGAPGKLLALRARDIDAGHELHDAPAEHNLAGDPTGWFTAFPATQPRFERDRVGSLGDEQGGLLVRGDAAGRDESVRHDIEQGIRSQHRESRKRMVASSTIPIGAQPGDPAAVSGTSA